jgi:hypothetical protein
MRKIPSHWIALAILMVAAVARAQEPPAPEPEEPSAPEAPEDAEPPADSPAPAPTEPAPEPLAAPTEPTAPSGASSADPRHTARSVAGAPRPGEARGLAREPERRGEWALWIPRVLLFPVRAVAEVIGYPIRRGIYTYEVYQLGPRVKSIFFNEEGTAGLFPVAFAETGFGLNVGARLILRRLADTDFELTGRASFGGRFRQLYSLKLSSEDTWDRFAFDLRLEGEVRPKDQFWGIGNGDEADEAPVMPLDPIGGELRQSRYRQRALRAALGGELALTRFAGARLSAGLTDREFDVSDERGEDQLIAQNFDVDQLTGFAEGSRHLYLETELRLDTRRSSSYWIGSSTPTTGFLISGFAGYALPASGSSEGYGRYGFDAQRYFFLGEGPRVLALRVYLEGVSGDYDEVPFNDLPGLGGALLLRGYDGGHFRDRVAGLASAEYQWDLSSEWFSAFAFADAGRVFPDLDSVSLEELRLGFGGGVELHTKTSFLGRLSLASSVDGGLFAILSFDPVYDVKARVERK